jgi:2-keto-4-pentenoate hydratase/2-oxohepta-3-ene-1,7-dioic acid hydratase in catechol pathway
MRFATVQTSNGPRAVALRDSAYVDLHATNPSLPVCLRQILDNGADTLRAVTVAAQQPNAVKIPAAQARLLAPIPEPRKVICIGLNYKDHAAESGSPIPEIPVVFSKYSTAVCGPDAAIVLPRISSKVDYEAELVIVIGKKGKHIKEAEALNYVAGYTVGHDVSARDWQLEKPGKQWMMGKTFDTFAPMGPHLVTSDEVPNPQGLGIRLRLNGETMQNSNTSQMIFSVATLVAHLSQVFTLEPGDVIFTGTPPGVGTARKPPVYLKPGDVTEVEIDGLGVLRNQVVAEA